MRTKWWRKSRAELLDEIRSELASGYPSLHLFEEAGRDPEVRGTFEVVGEGNRVLDSFLVRIVIPPAYPKKLPLTWEVGGRIPYVESRHIEADGKACVLLPDERWRVFPVGAPFSAYLRGPLQSFFLSQIAFELTGKWPFSEWGHSGEGVVQFYREMLGTTDLLTIARFLESLQSEKFEPFRLCPCGSGKRLKACCREKWMDLRQKIGVETARESFRYVATELAKSRAQKMLLARLDTPALRLMRAAGRT